MAAYRSVGFGRRKTGLYVEKTEVQWASLGMYMAVHRRNGTFG